MKKSGEILGQPIISIADGREKGTVKMLVIDQEQGTVAAIVVADAEWYLESKLLPFADIVNLGDDAITVQSGNHILKLSYAPDIEKMLDSNVSVIGSKVVTRTGCFLGHITEFMIDQSGKIVQCEVEESDGKKFDLSATQVIKFGKEFTLITESKVI